MINVESTECIIYYYRCSVCSVSLSVCGGILGKIWLDFRCFIRSAAKFDCIGAILANTCRYTQLKFIAELSEKYYILRATDV